MSMRRLGTHGTTAGAAAPRAVARARAGRLLGARRLPRATGAERRSPRPAPERASSRRRRHAAARSRTNVERAGRRRSTAQLEVTASDGTLTKVKRHLGGRPRSRAS